MSIFSNIFNKSNSKEKSLDSNVNPITSELHSHLIFDVDDGVKSIEEALEILQFFSDMGYKKVITTPHIMSDYYKNGPENLLPKLELTKNKLIENNIAIELEVAAEYMIDDGIEKKIEEKNILSFGGENKYVLVELPFMEEPRNFKSVIFSLQIQGFKPVLAHPERYMYYHQKKERYDELHDQGVLLQLNNLSLIGYYSPQILKMSEYIIDRKIHSFLGSDAHSFRHAAIINDKVISSKLYKKACEIELLNNTL